VRPHEKWQSSRSGGDRLFKAKQNVLENGTCHTARGNLATALAENASVASTRMKRSRFIRIATSIQVMRINPSPINRELVARATGAAVIVEVFGTDG
jgi:hypothetical protein